MRAKPRKLATKVTKKFSISGMFANPLSVLPGVEVSEHADNDDDSDSDSDSDDDDDDGDNGNRKGQEASNGSRTNKSGLRLKGKRR